MFRSLFKKDSSVEAADALYAAAAEQARAVPFYARLGVPDTVEGRFEMVTLHVWLILRRLKSDQPEARKISQKLFDATFSNFDAALRELGVGDLVVGKKIRKLAENFYGRARAYDAAIAGDGRDLPEALARNVYESENEDVAADLAGYVRRAAARLEDQPSSRIAGGIVEFPAAVEP